MPKTKLPTQVDFAAPARPAKGDPQFVDSSRAVRGLPDFPGPGPVTVTAPPIEKPRRVR